jgi:NAD(P)-dependent dehydrogenase (short-subunit alcohol dehydrogenase family)
MDLQLAGKVGLVTGASRGIGRAIAMCLAEEGMAVALVARTAGPLEALAELLRGRGGRAFACAADLREADAADRTVAAVVEALGGLDVLVNNAGATKRGDFLELSDADWADGYALKFFGYVRMARAAWPHLQARRGAMVNISGGAGRTGDADFTIGGTVNAAVALLGKALADRGVRDGVRVNTVHPGMIETDRMRTRLEQEAAERGSGVAALREEVLQSRSVDRFGRPEEVANLVAMLASPVVEYVQGSIVTIDGGQVRTL